MAGVFRLQDLTAYAVFEALMDSGLSGPLGSYPDRDEFQIGRMLVWVYYLEGEDRLLRLSKANAIFPALLAETLKVEVMASKVAGNNLY